MNALARCISATCAAWFIFYICWGSTTNGKDWFQNVAAANVLGFLGNDKAAVPVLTLCLPILVAGTTCAVLLLFLTSNSSSSSGQYDGVVEGGGGGGGKSTKRRPQKSEHHSGVTVVSTLPHQLPAWIHQSWYFVCMLRRKMQTLRVPKSRCLLGAGDAPMGVIALVFLVLPLSIFTFATIHRHLSGSSSSSSSEDMDYKVKEIGNSFGMAALVAMSYVLIPVSRHSPLLLPISPAHAIYLHHVAGRLVVGCGLLHGALHVYRWMSMQGRGLLEMVWPPRQCWTVFNNADDDDVDDDFCYTRFRNLTGTLAGVALVVLALTTTFAIIRRRFYTTIFWPSHVISAPWLYIMVIIHYEKAILYVAGGVLYYLATTMPVLLEMNNITTCTSFSSWRCSGSSSNEEAVFGVPIVAVQRIPAGSGGDGAETTTTTRTNSAAADPDVTSSGCIMSVTIQVDPIALERFRAGQYIRLLAPEISILAHPFTINICPLSLRQEQRLQVQQDDQDDANTTDETHGARATGAGAGDGTSHYCCMQIIFRATGNFTMQLAQRLLLIQAGNDLSLEERPQSPLPVSLRLDGFYGPSNRLRTALLQHDVILIVAGGIGITPYLSLLHQLHQNLVVSFRRSKHLQQSLVLEGAGVGAAESRRRPFRTKRIFLHWMCRDAALIEYIKREYFAPLLDDRSIHSGNERSDDNDFGIQLVIHQTGTSTRSSTIATASFSNRDDTHNPQDDDTDQNRSREKEAPQQQQPQELARLAERPVGGIPFRPSKFAAGTKTSYFANAPLFLSFCLIGWIGLIIIWYCYSTFDSKNQVMPRSYSMVCVLLLSFTIAVILNRLFTPAWEDRREDIFCTYSAIETSAHNDDVDETVEYDEEETTATGSIHRVESEKVNVSTSLHQTEQERMKDYRTGSDGLLRGALDDASFRDGGSGSARVTLEERCGRPNVREFMNAFDSLRANHPALYACGPNDLTRSMRVAVKERRCKIAFYQERFEL
jgi:Ferric reductase like transmembrane component/Ferric reductase NAD binding domain